MKDNGWILDGPVTVTAVAPDAVTVEGPEGQKVLLEYVERDGRGEVLLDGAWYDFGDDFPAVLGLLDAAGGLAPGESMTLDDAEPSGPEPHDCPKEQFLEDPVTRAYGVGSEMVGLVRCPVCEASHE